jgi:nucleoside-diphosphate-sugar epimerase
MKILVTGATGFIGAAVARQLSQQHHEVLALSRSDGAAAKLRVAGLTPVGGVLSVLAESLGSKAQTSDANYGSAGPCKASYCTTKARKKVLGAAEEHKN